MVQDFRSFAAFSFDCYGTLIDWQTGILNALRRGIGCRADADRNQLTPPAIPLSDDAIISAFAAAERRIQSGAYLPYREVLRQVAREVLGPSAPAGAVEALPDSVPSWPPFPDTNPALARLSERLPLAIASNIDNDLFTATRRHFAIPFVAIITAEEVRSYKPAERHFRELARRLGLPPGRILHIAESRYHDIDPAGRLGFGTVWINRTGSAPSASGPGGGKPRWTFGSLADFADAACKS